MKLGIGHWASVIGFLACALIQESRADGGAVLTQEVVGPYRVTLFGSPSPLRAGRNLSDFQRTAE